MAGEVRVSRAATVRGAPYAVADDLRIEWEPRPPCGPDPVTEIAIGLKNCLCRGLEYCNRPVCWCCVINSQNHAVGEWCGCDCAEPCCKGETPEVPKIEGLDEGTPEIVDPPKLADGQGMAWVRVQQQQWVPPTAARGGQGQVTASGASCAGGGRWRVTFNLGTLRCVTVPKDGKPLPCEGQEKDAFVGFADAEIMRWVVTCCPAVKRLPLVAAQWNPLGPQGGCAGGVMALTVDLIPPTDTAGCPPQKPYC
ncbi:hypothetical protein [Streptomyces noursei]